jgi:hypothetical protein
MNVEAGIMAVSGVAFNAATMVFWYVGGPLDFEAATA